MPQDDTVAKLLLSYISLLAARNAYGPGGGFEFALFDAVVGNKPSPLVSEEERVEISDLALRTGQWVTYDFETGMLPLIDMDEWLKLRTRE